MTLSPPLSQKIKGEERKCAYFYCANYTSQPQQSILCNYTYEVMCIYLFITLFQTSMACSNKYLVRIWGIMKQQKVLLSQHQHKKADDAWLGILDDHKKVTQDKPATEQFGFDNITVGLACMYHIVSTIHALESYMHAFPICQAWNSISGSNETYCFV